MCYTSRGYHESDAREQGKMKGIIINFVTGISRISSPASAIRCILVTVYTYLVEYNRKPRRNGEQRVIIDHIDPPRSKVRLQGVAEILHTAMQRR